MTRRIDSVAPRTAFVQSVEEPRLRSVPAPRLVPEPSNETEKPSGVVRVSMRSTDSSPRSKAAAGHPGRFNAALLLSLASVPALVLRRRRLETMRVIGVLLVESLRSGRND